MFRSNFDDFSRLGYLRSNPEVGTIEDEGRMTRFCSRNIPTEFGVQFLSFAVSTGEKCLGRILTTFSSPSTTRAGKDENRA